MKHQTLWTFSGLCLLFCSLSSCGEKTETRVSLSRKEDIDSTVMIHSVKELQDITRYDSCLLYVSLEGCHYCASTKEVLKSYIKETSALIYEVDRSVYASAYDETTNSQGKYAFLYPKLSGFPGFLFYQNGKLSDTYLNSLSSRDDLDEMLKDKAYLTNRYILNDVEYSTREDSYSFILSEQDEVCKSEITLGFTTAALDGKIGANTKCNVLFTWRRCSDCKNYNTLVLTPFLEKNSDAKLYYYETDGYMQLKREEGTIGEHVSSLWSDFCKKYHLTDFMVMDAYGNEAGYVPSMLSFENGDYRFSVFSNQNGVERNSDGTLSYTNTYYPELKNIKSKTKVDEGDSTSSTYQKALKELNESVQKEDITLNTKYLEEIFYA